MLTVYEIWQSEEWDRIVRSFADFDVYYLSGYVKAFLLHGDGQPLLFYYEDDHVRGINVVMKRDIAKDSRFSDKLKANEIFDFSTPYGYGGWLIEGENNESLFSAYEAWCISNNIVAEFVRFHPVLANHRFVTNGYDIIPLGNTVAMDLSSPEKIWENITSSNRNMIRKAEKNGVEIHCSNAPDLIETFREIYNATMDKDNASDYYYFSSEFYESIFSDLTEEAQLFYALYEDKIVSAAIMLTSNGRLNYHLSGSRQEYRQLASTNLLLYKAALWGFENGCKTFHLGGGVGAGEDGLFKFKKAFYRKDELPRFHIGKKVFDEEKYDELVNLRSNLPENGFFPKYRA